VFLLCCIVMCLGFTDVILVWEACMVCLVLSWWCGVGDSVLKDSLGYVVMLGAVCVVSLCVMCHVDVHML